MKEHLEEFKKMLIFFDFFEVFNIICFCTVSYSPVLYIIRFLMKFYVEAILWGRWETLGENAITCLIGFTGVENCVGSVKIK